LSFADNSRTPASTPTLEFWAMKMVGQKPAKPYQDFPLFAHACGQWDKKIKGRMYYLGVWGNSDAALQDYLKKKDFLQAGPKPPENDRNIVLVKNLCNAFLTAKQQRVDSDELSRATFADCNRSCELVVGSENNGVAEGSLAIPLVVKAHVRRCPGSKAELSRRHSGKI